MCLSTHVPCHTGTRAAGSESCVPWQRKNHRTEHRCDRAGHALNLLAIAKERTDHAGAHYIRGLRRYRQRRRRIRLTGNRLCPPEAGTSARAVLQVDSLAARQEKAVPAAHQAVRWDHCLASGGHQAVDLPAGVGLQPSVRRPPLSASRSPVRHLAGRRPGGGVIRKLESFLLELGAGFSFVARQKHIQIDDEDFHLDLLVLQPQAAPADGGGVEDRRVQGRVHGAGSSPHSGACPASRRSR